MAKKNVEEKKAEVPKVKKSMLWSFDDSRSGLPVSHEVWDT